MGEVSYVQLCGLYVPPVASWGAPQAPNPAWPLDRVTGQTTTPRLDWPPAPGASHYRVYFGTDVASLALYVTVTAPAVTAGAVQYQIYFSDNPNNRALWVTVKAPKVTESFDNLTSGPAYYWHAAAPGTDGTSAKNAVWSFITE